MKMFFNFVRITKSLNALVVIAVIFMLMLATSGGASEAQTQQAADNTANISPKPIHVRATADLPAGEFCPGKKIIWLDPVTPSQASINYTFNANNLSPTIYETHSNLVASALGSLQGGAGISFSSFNVGTLEVAGINQTSIAGAITDGDFLQFSFTTDTFLHSQFLGFLNQIAFKIKDPNDVGLKTYWYFNDPAAGLGFQPLALMQNDIYTPDGDPTQFNFMDISGTNPQQLLPNSTYWVRIYLYDANPVGLPTVRIDDPSITFFEVTCSDFGDNPDAVAGVAPGEYETTRDDNGPSHIVIDGLSLGALVDTEDGTLQNVASNADDADDQADEDGITLPAALTIGQTTTVTVNVTNTLGSDAYLNAWVDWNQDGDFLDASEQIASGLLTNNDQAIAVNVPIAALPGTTYARFRYSTQDALGPAGPAPDGEVEDYQVAIAELPELTISSSSSANGVASPADVITYTIAVSNTGNVDANNIVLTDTLPLGVTYVPGSSQSAYPIGDPPDLITDTAGVSLSPGELLTATLRVTVDDPLPEGVNELTHQVWVTADGLTASSPASSTDVTTLPIGTFCPGRKIVWLDPTTPGQAVVQYLFNSNDLSPNIQETHPDLVDSMLGSLQGGSGITFSGFNVGTLEIAGIDQTTIAGATADNDFLQFSFTTGSFTYSEFLGFLTGISFKIKDPNDVGLKTYWYFNDPSAGLGFQPLVFMQNDIYTPDGGGGIPHNTINFSSVNPQQLLPNSTYWVRIYLYDANPGSGPTVRIDDPSMSFFEVTCSDFGDNPDTAAGVSTGNYETTRDDNGANHLVVEGLALGTLVDTEDGTLQDIAASADDADDTADEDGVPLPAYLPVGESIDIAVSVTNALGSDAYLNAWFDWNQDGDFLDASEQVFNGLLVNSSQTLSMSIPSGASLGTTYARFRYSTQQALGPSGAAPDGEVEDYSVTLANPPLALDDSSLGNPPGPVSLSITGNDSDPDGDLDPATVDFDPASVPGGIGSDTDGDGDIDQVVVPGEGIWSVDDSGNVTFIPEVGFTGDPTPIDYTISDSTGLVSNVAAIIIDYVPVAVDDSSFGNPVGAAVTITGTVLNDSLGDSIDPTTVSVIPPVGATNIITDASGDVIGFDVPGEGSWGVDPVSGDITFTPEVGFTGDPTPIDYTVEDDEGNVSNPATVTIDYVPVAVDDSSLGNSVGSPVTIDVNGNDSLGDSVDPTTVSMIPPVGATNIITDASGDVIGFDVLGEGSWGVDPVSGDITFTPEVGFTGDPTPIDYTVEDDEGNVSNPATVTIDYVPVAVDDSSLGNSVGSPVTIDVNGNDSLGDSVDPTTVSMISPVGATNIITDASGDVIGFDVLGEGSWGVDPVSGDITFTPEVGFTGDPTPIDYTVEDDEGNVSNPATVTIDYVPVAVDDSSLGNSVGSPVTIDVNGNDSLGDSVDPTTVSMIPPVGATNIITDASGDIIGFDVPGEGSWGVDPVSGDITFTPEISFTGDPTPIDYTVEDDEGNVSNPATVTIDYVPVAVDDSSLGNSVGSPVTIDVNGNDSLGDSVDPTTVSMIPPVGATNIITDASGDVIGFDVPGEGSWGVDPVSGDITFTPEISFTGDPTPIDYTVEDDEGNVSNPATVTIDYVPVAVNDSSTDNPVGSAVTVAILGNDSLGDSVDPSTVSMIPPVGATNIITDASGDVIGFDVLGEGVWSVDPVSGDITFTPEPGFSSDPTPIDYTVDDDEGNVSNPATVLIDYLAATAVALQTLSTSSGVTIWLWLMVMLVLIGIGGAFMFRPKSDH